MDDDLPSPFIKKRSKVIRPSGSSSSLRSISSAPGAAAPSAANADDEEDEGNVAVVRSRGKKTPAGRVKDREGGSKPKSRLSFGAAGEDEDSDSSFSIKRESGTPRKLLRRTSTASLSQDAPPLHLDQATISTPSAAPSIYSKEYLDQLKATTSSAPKPRSTYDDLTRSKFGDRIDTDEAEAIPTSAAIASAKEKREQMRAAGVGSGESAFISLDVGFANKGGDSRLVREEDEIGDGDEELAAFTGSHESVPLGKKANREAAAKMKSDMMDLIQDAEEEEEDDEAREWEEAQIRRGGDAAGRRDDARSDKKSKTDWKAAPIPASSTLPTLSSVSARISTALTTLKTSHQVDAAALEHFAHERADLDAQENELREEVGKVSEKNRWFAEFKAFVEELAAFLDDKVPALEKIEKENLAIQKERFEIVSRRRYEDNSDDVALFTGAAVKSTFVPPTLDDVPMEDDLPPSSDLAPRSSTRDERRQARLRRSASRQTSTSDDPISWTDDELSPSDSSDLSSALTTLKDSLSALFADVKADDFRDPNLGLRRRFEEWRERYRDDYENAFAGLGLVGVWEFWARVEMALWNPFEIDQLARTPVGLDAYRWHANLTEFGHSTSEGEAAMHDGDAEDESQVVVNAMIASVVIPRLQLFARESFDPYSRKQTTRALGLVDEVSYGVERSSPRFQNLILSFISRIQLLITQSQSLIAPHLNAIALPQNAFDPSTFEARTRFAQRQLKLVQTSLRWRRWAKGLRGSDGAGGLGATLDELITRELVAKVILPVVEAGWSAGGNEVAAKLLEILPGDMVPPALRRRLEGEK